MALPHLDSLVVSVSTYYVEDCEWALRQSHQRSSKKWYTLYYASRYKGRSLAVQPDCVRGWVVCGYVYKDLLESITGVGYCIPVLDFNLVLHDF